MYVKLWKRIQRIAIMDSTLQQLKFEKVSTHSGEREAVWQRGLGKHEIHLDEWRYVPFSTLNKKFLQMMKGLSERCETPDLLENNSGKKALRYRHGGGRANFLEQWQKISPGKSSLELMMGCQETENHLHSKGSDHKREEKACTVGRNFADCISDRWLIFDLYK